MTKPRSRAEALCRKNIEYSFLSIEASDQQVYPNPQIPMEREKFDLETITEGRRKSIESSIAEIDAPAVKALGEKLFPYFDHPWREPFLSFVEANAGSTFYHATTHDGVEILFCDDKEKGIWCLSGGGGVGPLQSRGLAMMKAIVAKLHVKD